MKWEKAAVATGTPEYSLEGFWKKKFTNHYGAN